MVLDAVKEYLDRETQHCQSWISRTRTILWDHPDRTEQRRALNVLQEPWRTTPEDLLKTWRESCLRVQTVLKNKGGHRCISTYATVPSALWSSSSSQPTATRLPLCVSVKRCIKPWLHLLRCIFSETLFVCWKLQILVMSVSCSRQG